MKVLVLGASGLVGSALLNLLTQELAINEIHCINRKSQNYCDKKIIEHIADYSTVNDILPTLPKIDVVYSCLGTTKSKTPDQAVYKTLEIAYPALVGSYLKEKSLSQFHYISAIGADAKSSIFYTRTKGEAEQRLKKLSIPHLFIYRPSLITGERKESRFLEKLSSLVLNLINPLLMSSWRKYRSISANAIAKAMLYASLHPTSENCVVLESDKIQALSERE